MKTLTESELDGMLCVYYMNKLVEFKLVEGPIPRLTLKGFELADDLYQSGRKVSEEQIIKYTEACIPNADDEFKKNLNHMIIHLQNVGFEQMKEEVKNLNNKD